jgi:hypothetical protein
MLLVPFLGRNFFPAVDAGQIMIHVRAPVGSRIEQSAMQFDRMERRIRQLIPTDQISTITDNIGLPVSAINTVYNNSGTIGPQDGDILITLGEGHKPTADYVAMLRARNAEELSGLHLRLPAGRHHDPDPELRRPRSDRYPGCGSQCCGQCSLCLENHARDPLDTGRRGCAHPADGPLSAAERGHRSHPDRPVRPHRARRDQQPRQFARRHVHHRARLLPQSG